eukprot:927368-Rhodomonas_salina.2
MTMRERRGEKVAAAAAVAAAAGVLCVLVVVLSGGTRGDGVALLDAAKVGKGSSYYSYENDPWRVAFRSLACYAMPGAERAHGTRLRMEGATN